MSFTRRPGSGRPHQTSRREDRHIVRNARVQPTASSVAIREQVAPSMGAHVSSQTIRRRQAEGHLGSRRPLRVLPLTPTHRCLRLEWCHARGNWTEPEWNQIVFSDESRFNHSSDDNRVRAWRPRGERLNPAFALQRHTAPTAGVVKKKIGEIGNVIEEVVDLARQINLEVDSDEVQELPDSHNQELTIDALIEILERRDTRHDSKDKSPFVCPSKIARCHAASILGMGQEIYRLYPLLNVMRSKIPHSQTGFPVGKLR
ncbi:transposable element Tcb2 transposase [Trichonephila clavipes]|nr:transposable element Tcb2 transposase [Trichonephila clavipes]